MAFFEQQAVRPGELVYLPNGHKIQLDFVLEDDLNGYIASDNGYIVNQIRSAISNRTGGWIEISEAEYNEAVKKKAIGPSQKSKRRSYHGLNAGMFQPRTSVADAEFVAAEKPDPIQVPTPEQMKLPPRPRVGKMVTT